MKGIVFDFNRKKRLLRFPDIKKRGYELKELLSRFGIQLILAALFMLGLIVGAASSKGFDSETFDRLDLLFITNIDARRGMSVFDIFTACFVSYFLFIIAVFLAALSSWGFAAIPLITALKGFTAGLSSAFIFSMYKLSGIGFYILIILPGTVLFLFALIRYSTVGFGMSLRYMRLSVFGAEKEPELRVVLKRFFKKTLIAFLSSAACAAADMLLWIVFADKFTFQ